MITRPSMFYESLLPFCRYLLTANLILVGEPCIAQSYSDTTSQFSIKADRTEIDEGEVVNFELINLKYRDGTSGALWDAAVHPSRVNWQFEGDAQATGTLGLYKNSHRFMNDSEAPSKIGVRHQGTDEVITIQVKNVKPKIYRMWHSKPAFKDQPVMFHALATDPGIRDELTFNWDFGDGDSATGQHVEHTFSGTGDYQVTLQVADEIEFDIKAMDVDIETTNSFVVSGDVSLPRMEIDQLILAASTDNPMQKNSGGSCQIRLQMGNEALGAAITLTANLDPGFGVRDYPVGAGTEWDGSHKDDRASQGTFFADLSLPASVAIRDIGGRKVGGPFWSENGTVTIDKFDKNQLDLSFEATLLENIPGEYDPRRTRVSGNLSTHVERSRTGVLTGLGNVFSAMNNAVYDPDGSSGFKGVNFYLCDEEDPGTFDIESWQPQANETSTKYEDAEISVTFTQKVDPETLKDNAYLQFRARGGFSPIPGGWEVSPDDPKTIRFIPQAYLLPAVIYCMRIDTDELGLRSVKGHKLVGSSSHGFSNAMRPACENASSSSLGSKTRRSAFSTQVELASVRVDLYQTSLVGVDTLLVPNKPTLARVYPYWHESNAIHPTAMVKEFEAMVEVGSDSGLFYAPKKAKIKRPDQYTWYQTKRAQNSVNFYGWRPGASKAATKLFAEIGQLNQAGELVEPFKKGEKTVVETWPHEAELQKLTIQPFFVPYQGDCSGLSLGGCDWSTGISAYWRGMAQQKLAEAMTFTTQNFPVVSTVNLADQAEIPTIQFTAPGSASECVYDEGFYCYNAGSESEISVDEYVADLMFDFAGESDADILLGFVPPGFFIPGDLIGLQSEDSQGRLLVYAQLDEANAATITHEFGHFFGLEHCPPGEDDDPCGLTPIQAFRANTSGSSGFNKHHVEGNQQSPLLRPLMNPTEHPVDAQFITVSQYRKLFGEIHDFQKSNVFMPMPADQGTEPSWLETLFLPASAFAQGRGEAEQQQLIVSGTARNGQIYINRIRVLPARQVKDTPKAKGPYTLELRNAQSNMIQTYPFELNKSRRSHGRGFPTASFRVSVPVPAYLHSIRISGPGGVSATAEASPNKPTVSASIGVNKNNGLKTLRWVASDADGDTLWANVYLKGDDGDWHGVAANMTGSQLQIPVHDLPAALTVTARIIISDGFNSTSTELDAGAGAPLSVLVTHPTDGAKEVNIMTEISAWVSNPLLAKSSGLEPVALPSGKITLTDASGLSVAASVSYLAAERIITLTPHEPLTPASTYQVTLSGLEDRWKNALGDAFSWRFETGPQELDPDAPPEIDDLLPDEITESPKSPVATNEPSKAARSDSGQSAAAMGSKNQADQVVECTCKCDIRLTADELCQMLCEEEFAACESP